MYLLSKNFFRNFPEFRQPTTSLADSSTFDKSIHRLQKMKSSGFEFRSEYNFASEIIFRALCNLSRGYALSKVITDKMLSHTICFRKKHWRWILDMAQWCVGLKNSTISYYSKILRQEFQIYFELEMAFKVYIGQYKYLHQFKKKSRNFRTVDLIGWVYHFFFFENLYKITIILIFQKP